VTIERLEAQLAAENSRCAEAISEATSKGAAVEIERRNYLAVQDVLGSTRRELEDIGAKWRAGEVEGERLTGVIRDFETERKTWTALHQSFMEAKMCVCMCVFVCVCVCVTERKTWTALHQSFMQAKMCVYLCVFVCVCD